MTVRTPDWVKDAVFYQIFPDRFAFSNEIEKPPHLEPWDTLPSIHGFKGGDLLGVVERLDYLVDLGVNAIYFNPIFQSAANHRYHTYDYYTVDPLLGGNDAFRRLIEAVHARGIRIVLDGVFNHASRGFYQFHHLMENGDKSPYLDWFHVGEFPLNAYNHQEKPNYGAWFGLRALPEFNTDTEAVRDFLFDVTEYWLKRGIDGWRLDVPLEIKTPGFWEEFRRRVKAINPEAYILAEIWNDHEAQPWLQGEHFDAIMNYPFNRACLGFFAGSSLLVHASPGGYQLERLDAPTFARNIEKMLHRYHEEVVNVQYNLLGSHDEARFLTLASGDRDRLRLATLFQMTYPGAPSIYYGDEIGMVGGPDPDCRRAFPWDRTRWDEELRADFRRFVALRHEHPVLRYGRFTTLYAKGWVYAFLRQDDEETFVVVMNAGNAATEVEIDLEDHVPQNVRFDEIWGAGSVTAQDGALKVSLEPLAARVFLYRS